MQSLFLHRDSLPIHPLHHPAGCLTKMQHPAVGFPVRASTYIRTQTVERRRRERRQSGQMQGLEK